MSERPLNATAASLLGFLQHGPLTGWDLVVTAQRTIGNFWSLTQSQVYRELTAMSRDGLVEAGERGPRDRRPYAITARGRERFASWLRADPARETIRFPLLLTLSFGAELPPERLAEILREQRTVHADRLAAYDRRADELDDPYALATLDFGRAFERCVLEWIDRLPARLPGMENAISGSATEADDGARDRSP